MLQRLLSATPIGLGVTMSLLLLMHLLIDSGPDVFEDPATNEFPIWLTEVRPDTPVEPPPPIDRPAPPDPLPPTDLPPIDSSEFSGVGVRPPVPKPPVQSTFDFSTQRFGEGPLVQMVVIQPAYPESAIRRRLEGFVTVRFDVTAEGLTHNVAVVESTHTVFEKAAIRAAEKFRFKPQVVDGTPLPSAGVRYRFRFELER